MAKSLLDLANKNKVKIDLNVPSDYVGKNYRAENYLDFFNEKLPERLVTLSADQFIWPKSWVVLADAVLKPVYKVDQNSGFNVKNESKQPIQDGDKTYISFKAGSVDDALEQLNRYNDPFRARTIEIHCLNSKYNLQDLAPARTMFKLVKPQVALDFADSRNFSSNHPIIICEDIQIEQ